MSKEAALAEHTRVPGSFLEGEEADGTNRTFHAARQLACIFY